MAREPCANHDSVHGSHTLIDDATGYMKSSSALVRNVVQTNHRGGTVSIQRAAADVSGNHNCDVAKRCRQFPCTAARTWYIEIHRILVKLHVVVRRRLSLSVVLEPLDDIVPQKEQSIRSTCYSEGSGTGWSTYATKINGGVGTFGSNCAHCAPHLPLQSCYMSTYAGNHFTLTI